MNKTIYKKTTDEDIKQVFAYNLKVQIVLKRKTLKIVANETHINYNTLCAYSNAKYLPQMENLTKIAKCFNVSIYAFFFLDEPEFANSPYDENESLVIFGNNIKNGVNHSPL